MLVDIENSLWSAKYVATKNIPPGDEIFGEYEPYIKQIPVPK
jgi:hypothetical protein